MSLTIAGKNAGPIGFGLLSLNRPPAQPYSAAVQVMKAALSNGANVWNGATFYGPPTANSLHLLHHYFSVYPEDASKVIITMKGAFTHAGPDGSATSVKRSIDTCLEILDGKAFIDTFAPGRIDVSVPLEETIGAIAEYVKAGKIGGIGLSECNANTIRRAHAIHPISVVEVELSLFSHDILTNGVAATCAELGIPIIAYSPLSRGALSGQFQKLEDLPAGDMRRSFPRFQPEVYDLNQQLTKEVERLAEKKGCTVAQVAIAWVVAQGGKKGGIVPIPGCTTVARVEENLSPVALSEGDLEEITGILSRFEVKGDRYGEAFKKYQDL